MENERRLTFTHIAALAEDFQSKLATGLEPLIDINRNLKTIVEMVAQNTEDITILRFDTQFIKQELKQKVSVEEFNALEKRVLHLEHKTI